MKSIPFCKINSNHVSLHLLPRCLIRGAGETGVRVLPCDKGGGEGTAAHVRAGNLYLVHKKHPSALRGIFRPPRPVFSTLYHIVYQHQDAGHVCLEE